MSLETLPEDNIRREVQGFRIVKRAIAQVAPLLLSPKLPVPLSHHEPCSCTPGYKTIPARVSRAAVA